MTNSQSWSVKGRRSCIAKMTSILTAQPNVEPLLWTIAFVAVCCKTGIESVVDVFVLLVVVVVRGR